jgi:hypothetical protein
LPNPRFDSKAAVAPVARSNGRCSQPTLVPSKRLTSVFGVLWDLAVTGVAIGSIIARARCRSLRPGSWS